MSRKEPIAGLREIASASREANTTAERAGLYAGAHTLVTELKEYIDLHMGGSGYAHEKLSYVLWNIGAMLGFRETNGHSTEDYYVWFLGDIGTFEGIVAADD